MNTSLTASEKWFADMGIRTVSKASELWVNRDDMANLGDSDEILKALRESIGSTKVFWGGKDDNWIYLESF